MWILPNVVKMVKWRFCRCLMATKADEDGAYARQMAPGEELALAEVNKRSSFISEEKRGIAIVELVKKEGCPLGLTITGGVDKGCRPKISNLRPGSLAYRSDALEVGDNILSVNGIRTNKLKHEEIVNLLKNAGDKVILEVEYEVPTTSVDSSMCVSPKTIQIKLEKENGSFGFTLRGGACDDHLKSRPLIITHVRPGSPADREGSIKAGDRLLAVKNINLTNAKHTEALAILKQVDREAWLTIEYDVSIMDAVRNASGPLLIEIDKTLGSGLGITLMLTGYDDKMIICIESIKAASIAERCGALHVGDQILAIDEISVEHMTLPEASCLFKNSIREQVKLEILPLSQMKSYSPSQTMVKKAPLPPPTPGSLRSINYNTLSSLGGYAQQRHSRKKRRPREHIDRHGSSSSLMSTLMGMVPGLQVCHSETTEVTIMADSKGFGFSLQGGVFTTEAMNSPIIGHIEPGGAAERTGVLQAGDRVIVINGRYTEELTLDEAHQVMRDYGIRCTLEVEFDVAESVVPSTGTFTVKLAKRGVGLGITITSPSNRGQGEPLLISDIKKGSIAHRTGTIQPGDKLLAIDNIRLDNCSIEDAAQILQNSDDIVKLRIRKDEAFSDEPDPNGAVTYTVELVRHGGPLGITISGTEEPFDPIVLSGLTEGGLAERTGALHVGDRLLAINSKSLRGKTLSEAIQMLQNAGDIVTLKISKACENIRSKHNGDRTSEIEQDDFMSKFGSTIPSIDSAVESWDSSGLETMHTRPIAGAISKKTLSSDGVNKAGLTSTRRPHSSRSLTCRADGSVDLQEEGVNSEDDWDTRTNGYSYCSYPSSNEAHSEQGDKEWNKALEDLETCGEAQLLRQIEASIMSGSICSVDLTPTVRSHNQSDENVHISHDYRMKDDFTNRSNTLPYNRTQREARKIEDHPIFPSPPLELHKVTLYKDKVYEDFGFSVSDGLYERGIYVNRIRPGGPADMSGMLKPYDRILQVNSTKTRDFDCCLAVPLIATAGDKIDVLITRNPLTKHIPLDIANPWEDMREDSPPPPSTTPSTLTKTL